MQAHRLALAGNVRLGAAGKARDPLVREAEALPANEIGNLPPCPGLSRGLGDLALRIDQRLDFPDEPGIDGRKAIHLLHGDARPARLRHPEEPAWRGRLHLLPDALQLRRRILRAHALPPEGRVQAVRPVLHRAQRLLQRDREGAPDGHHLAHRLHAGGERLIRMRELLEIEARDLHHAVVDGRLEARRRRPGDVVGDLVERVTDGELGRDLGDGEPGRLRGQGGGPAHPRIHFDHHDAARLRMHAELDVRPAGLHADGADHLSGQVAHGLVLDVGERLRGGHGDRVARVHAHRVDVLDAADDHDVVGLVAHHLQLELLPAEDRFLDQHFVRRAVPERPRPQLLQLLPVVGDSTPEAPESEAGPQDEREPELVSDAHHVVERGHAVLEALPVLGFLDRLELRADEAAAVLRQDPFLGELHRQVQRGLPAHGGQDRVRTLHGDDALGRLHRDRLDVRAVRPLRVRHDRRRVGVQKNSAVPLFPQRLERLHARVVELASLPDDDGTRAEQEDGLEVFSTRHLGGSM